MGKDRSVARNVDLVVCQLAVPAPAVAEGFFLGAAAAVVDWVSDSEGTGKDGSGIRRSKGCIVGKLIYMV